MFVIIHASGILINAGKENSEVRLLPGYLNIDGEFAEYGDETYFAESKEDANAFVQLFTEFEPWQIEIVLSPFV